MCYSDGSSNYLVRGAEDYLTGGGDMITMNMEQIILCGRQYPPSTSVTSSQTLISVGDLSNNNGFKIGLTNKWWLVFASWLFGCNGGFASTNGKYAGLNGFQWNQLFFIKLVMFLECI